MTPKHYRMDLDATVARLRERFDKCREACPPDGSDPERVARWEGAFMCLRAVLVEELEPLARAWGEGVALWRATEAAVARDVAKEAAFAAHDAEEVYREAAAKAAGLAAVAKMFDAVTGTEEKP